MDRFTNKKEISLQVRFDEDEYNELLLNKNTPILGGELIAVDFDGARFKDIYTDLNLISVEVGLPDPVRIKYESNKLLVRYLKDENSKEYRFGFAWAIRDSNNSDPDYLREDDVGMYFELDDDSSTRILVTHWAQLPETF